MRRRLLIRRVKALPNYTLILTLSDGRKVERSLAALAKRAPGPFGATLRRQFEDVKIVAGVPTWCGTFDLNPWFLIYGPNWIKSRRVPASLAF
jgi:hypothetical protein